jgi:hypothetical protein
MTYVLYRSGAPVGKNSEDRDLRCNGLELLEGSILVYRDMRSGSGRAALERELLEPHLLFTPVA